MTKHDLYWLAGFLEGEGTFGFYGYTQKPQARVAVASTDLDVIRKAATLLGAKTVRVNRSRNRLGKKRQYIAAVYSTRALEVMHALYPLLGKRRQRTIRAGTVMG